MKDKVSLEFFTLRLNCPVILVHENNNQACDSLDCYVKLTLSELCDRLSSNISQCVTGVCCRCSYTLPLGSQPFAACSHLLPPCPLM